MEITNKAAERNLMERGKAGRPSILGSRHDRPVPVGVTIKTMIVRQARNPSTVNYNLEITALEVLRGNDALVRIRKEGVTEEGPKSGFEYLMALLRFKYYPKARGLSEYEPYVVDHNQFHAVSQDGNKAYGLPHLNRQPEPRLIGATISINESLEGWIVLQVPLDEKEPLLSFDRDYIENRLTLRTARGLLWFKLFHVDPMKIEDSCVECARPGT
jgi:hypothetical protein